MSWLDRQLGRPKMSSRDWSIIVHTVSSLIKLKIFNNDYNQKMIASKLFNYWTLSTYTE